ncbi:small RNA 2'-O-methyltransferase-like isoform X2 [Pistacia vera]|uniref:small RNA 2'-O-methyltransferase-like isoform X2 n=1 Tax=Pistacia vera TaxID=55513 RepID=UPI001262FFE8|nr:small RNA 2'-O-methyltransferase-like isoform X2 [Pistacia vera]XP_031249533.1 small RNA 2'-O-methyltransferase-like isoform X2 [Pistacia vera]
MLEITLVLRSWMVILGFQLGIETSMDNPSAEEAFSKLIGCVKYLFSDEFLSSLHPLSGHFRAALQRGGDLYSSVPASIMAVCDSKLSNLCKLINPEAELNNILIISYIMRAAARLSESVVTFEGQLSIWRKNPYPPNIIESLVIQQSNSPNSICVGAIYIPCSLEKAIQSVTLDVSSTGYYLDVIARKLGLTDGNKVLVSRTLGKASSEMRLYFAAPKSFFLDLASDLPNVKEVAHFEGLLNPRASYFYGQEIYGDAILASIGYTWRSQDLFHEDITLQSYYRMLINLMPSGVYKLSREAILTAELPLAFTAKTNWRGSFPREILSIFCRQHWLSEPVYSTVSMPFEASSESSRLHQKLVVPESAEREKECIKGGGNATSGQEPVRCEVKLFSKCQDLILECSPKELHKKLSDSIQNASLKVLSWLNAYLKDPDMSLEKLNYSAGALDIRFSPENFFKKFALCRSSHNVHHSESQGGRFLKSNSINMLDAIPEHGVCCLSIGGPDFGVCPSNGSLLFISYSVSLVIEAENMKELLESKEEFEFEIGTGAVISCVEAVITQMSVGQSACFNTQLPPQELILAAADDTARTRSLLSSKACCLEYSISLLRMTEPPEERMEQALFSPPLSKQRVEYAVQHIKESCATTLVDFGCGSGSLLDSLLDYPTALEKIVGVDISLKSLSRAAKILHSKLNSKLDTVIPRTGITSAVLYDGSITVFDSRLRGFDIGTCLEVIEHMEEDDASLFGNIVLSSFRPRILIVSTPNYEYNVVLHKSSLTSQEDDPDDKTQSQSFKFRNHDHKFEWTREQFNRWASELAARHGYSVEFSGVGGSADTEPGFASQIAIFRIGSETKEDTRNDEEVTHHYGVIWEWDSSNCSRSAF